MDTFDVVIVGSGFGGAVTAYRLAEAGRSVLVLERGAAYPPHGFARTPHAMARNFWDPGSSKFGLFDVWSFGHLDAVVSAGLGGGSLIYANVLLRKDPKWFVADEGGTRRPWPVMRTDLDRHYDAVEEILTPQVFPLGAPGYEAVHKTAEFKAAAKHAGYVPTTFDQVSEGEKQWFLPPLAVTFANEGRAPVPGETIVERVRNLHDRDRQTCVLCGECDIGCNYGAKNTLDHTYLTLAKRAGAELRTLAEVTGFAPTDEAGAGSGPATGGARYQVTYRQHPDGSPVEVGARHLVLSAGTLGTTRLLLQARDRLGPLSPRLGQRFSGNGDLLTLATAAREDAAQGGGPRLVDASNGPVITSTMRTPDEVDGGESGARGMYLQDAGYPVFVAWLAETASLPSAAGRVARFAAHRLDARLLHHDDDTHADPELEALLADNELAGDTLPLLGMGLDEPSGELRLEHDQLVLDWEVGPSREYYRQAVEMSKDAARGLGAEFHQDPLTRWFGRYITVHPLGGCAMADTADDGVVDPWGRVFGNPGLHVADGSVMPGPVGPNPSLTIAALADRFADALVKDLKGP